ncbi:MAG: glycosyltransferase [Caulobacteraceae bacterium]
MNKSVFYDPSGKRARRAGFLLGLGLALTLAIFAAFAATLALAPLIPNISFRNPRVLTAAHEQLRGKGHRREVQWTKVPRPHARGSALRPLNVAFYANWDDSAHQSLKEHLKQIDVFSPQWVALKTAGGALEIGDDETAERLFKTANWRPSVMPLVHNAHNELFDGKMADTMLADPQARRVVIASLVDQARKRGFSGYVFDFENLSAKGLAAYPTFIAEANAALDPSGREVWVTAPFDDAEWPLKALQKASDTLVLMAYDQHYLTGDAGAVAGQGWFEHYLQQGFAALDPNKAIIALGSYGYDWSGKARADALTFHEATLAARDSGVPISFDRATLNPTFKYDEDGETHTVWFLDAATLFNQIKVADPWRPRGYALWKLGAEDPGVWSVLGKPYGGLASVAGLATLPPSHDVDYNGYGEILNVTATPTPGKRTLVQDPATGLVTSERYDVIPTAYVIQRLGEKSGRVALTFDDGPDPRWTPKILDILKEKRAPATFFVIGENMETWPSIVERELAEGHVVGSHTYTHPNIGDSPKSRVAFELNLTQRLFQVVTGRTLRFFRPPYLGDAEPSTAAEVEPLLTAQKFGYLIVGLRIDPDDWQKPDSKLIIERTLKRLDDGNRETGGQVVLLHDSGGDRSHTVAALPELIDQLRARGYELTTVAELADLTPNQAMPPTTAEKKQLMLDRAVFDIVRNFDRGMTVLFISAIALGLGRLIFLVVLALIHRSRIEGRTPPELSGEGGAVVSVLIPCFNEESVVVSSVQRILASTWINIEVLVLDDGSTDATAARVRDAFGDHPKVRLLSFENGGKANALNRGLAMATGEIVVALDADTQFPPKTIGRLARWFDDAKVGGVAGNALVGNRRNLLTRWQALEYVTAQNLERRALAALGAVTVVPGAVGAWRRRALEALGGFPLDTLAEDQDLTLAVQRAGWRVEFDPTARAYTEAPETLEGLLKQRFRWSFGTLQCVWKHRGGLFDIHRPVLGFIALPQIWLFQIMLALVAPLVDLAVVYSIVVAVFDRLAHAAQWDTEHVSEALFYWIAFVLVDLSAASAGMALEKEAPWGSLVWAPIQRFGYRQLMYYVVVKAVITAVRGPRVGWGKLERKASVAMGAGG